MFKMKIIPSFHLKLCRRSFSSDALSVAKIFQQSIQSNQKIKVQGWVKSIRKMKENIFFDVSDGSCEMKLQVLLPAASKPQDLAIGASVVATGGLGTTPKGHIEMTADSVEVIGNCKLDEGYPFAPRKTYASDYVRQYLHLRPRTNKFSSLLRVRDAAVTAFNNRLHDAGYINIHTPILTSNDCEGAGEVFLVHPDNKTLLNEMKRIGFSPEETYFDSKVFLTVSGQLHLEAAAHGLSKVYTLGPTFRAENSRSRLHLSEFYMLEAEIAFIDTLEEIIAEIETLIKAVTSDVLNKHEQDVARSRENEVSLDWIHKKFAVITFDEAVEVLTKSGTYNVGNTFSKEDEIFLVKHCGGVPTFVINWPKKDKPFYMRECLDDSTKVSALDLLGPNIGEIVGGSLREPNHDKLKERLPSKNLHWYSDLRKFGGVSTGGYGLGLERYLQLILGISSIKDVIPFPRWPHNCKL